MEIGTVASIAPVLTTYQIRMVCSKRWPFSLSLGITWLLVPISVGVTSSFGSRWELLIAAPQSRVPFGLVFYLSFNHVRRVVLLIILVWLILGRLHKVHLCIGLRRWVVCLGLSMLFSHVFTWPMGGSSSVIFSSCVLGPPGQRVRSSLVIFLRPISQILLRHMMTLKSGLRHVLGRLMCVTRILTIVA